MDSQTPQLTLVMALDEDLEEEEEEEEEVEEISEIPIVCVCSGTNSSQGCSCAVGMVTGICKQLLLKSLA